MGKRRSVSAPLIIGGLVAFLLVDLALVFLALNANRAQGTASSTAVPFTALPTITSTARPTSSPTPTPTAAPTSTAAPTPTPTPTATAAALEGFASSTVGYRATPGSCSGPDSVIELTTDAGATWSNVNPSNIRIREVDSIIVVDSDHVDLLARYGDDCTLSAVSTYTQGQYWQVYPDRTAQLQNQ